MQFQQWSHLFLQQLLQTSLPEWIAMFFGVASVLLARANNFLLYPTGIISTGVYIYIFLQPSVKLYADALLNVYYLVMSVYGWLLWTQKKGAETAISKATPGDWLTASLIAGIGWILLYLVLSHFTDSTVPAWDAFISATAWSGMWLLAKHKIENWLMLNLSNLAAIPLYIHKQLPLTAILTLLLFIVAIFGFIAWKKTYRRQYAAA